MAEGKEIKLAGPHPWPADVPGYFGKVVPINKEEPLPSLYK